MCTLDEGKFMRFVIMLISVVLTLLGCNERPRTTVVTMSSTGEAGANAIRATISEGVGKFQCIKSVSGDCTYVLFLSECPRDSGSGKAECNARQVSEFTLKTGMSKEIAGLPEGFKFCVGHGAKPAIPGCLK